MPRYDAIVIGAGLGGLTAGALLAQTGRKVLVLERNDAIGGAATVYRHGALTIEASLHEIDGFDADDPKLDLFRRLGLDSALTLVDVPDMYEVRGGPVGAPFVLPAGGDAALAAVQARFPAHAEGVARFFGAVQAARAGTSLGFRHRDDKAWWLSHLPEAARALWPLIRHSRATLGDVLRDLFGDDEAVKCAVAANLGYYHDDPERMLFLAFAVPTGSYLQGGGHYVRGGSAALSAALAEQVRSGGGTVLTGQTAVRIDLDGERVAAVVYADAAGQIEVARTPLVFGNAAPQVLAGLLPADRTAAFLAAYAGRAPSVSLWTVALGLSRPAADLGVRHYATVLLPEWLTALADHREAAAIMAEPEGPRLPPFGLADYGRIDSGLPPGPPFLVTLTGLDRLATWERLGPKETRLRKDLWMERLIGAVDAEFPGFAAAVTQREMSTAATLRHYLNTPGGAVYGFAPEQFGGSPRTPIRGLYLASAWTMGGGFTGAMLGGAAAVREADAEA